MSVALVFNPGSNSLKFELVEMPAGQRFASDATKLASVGIDDIGKKAKLTVYAKRGHEAISQADVDVAAMTAGTHVAFDWLRKEATTRDAIERLSLVGVRVVHGGDKYGGAVRVGEEVRRDIAAFEELAPLHNKSSLEILDVVEQELPGWR